MSEHVIVQDPCGDVGPTQRWAIVWFFAVLLFGLGLVFTLRNTDHYNYMTNGEFFDYNAYGENRFTSAKMHGDSPDERSQGDYATAARRAASGQAPQ